jgi:hypothetical protein
VALQLAALFLVSLMAVLWIAIGLRLVLRESQVIRRFLSDGQRGMVQRMTHDMETVRLSDAEERTFDATVAQFKVRPSGLRFR